MAEFILTTWKAFIYECFLRGKLRFCFLRGKVPFCCLSHNHLSWKMETKLFCIKYYITIKIVILICSTFVLYFIFKMNSTSTIFFFCFSWIVYNFCGGIKFICNMMVILHELNYFNYTECKIGYLTKPWDLQRGIRLDLFFVVLI